MASFLLGAYNAADTAILSASLNGLASGAYALGGTIDNSASLYPLADLELILSSAVTAGSVNPSLQVFLLPTLDGVTYPNPPGSTAAATGGTYLVGTAAIPGSASFQVLHALRIPLTQKFKIMILNNTGVAFPATSTSTLKLYRYAYTSV